MMLDFIPHMLQGSKNRNAPPKGRALELVDAWTAEHQFVKQVYHELTSKLQATPDSAKRQRMPERGVAVGNSLPRYRTQPPAQLVSGQRLQPQNGYTFPDSTLNFEIQ